MTILSCVAEALAAPLDGCSLVPTMGALHDGHIQLIRAAFEFGRPVAVSIFVNPTQFGANEDFTKYPRDLSKDLELLKSERVSWIFAPTATDIYPRVSTMIHVPEVTEEFEGALRPGHFDGVATVVCKLIQICRPYHVIFGLKDLQQCAVLKRMSEDLNLAQKLHFNETVRDEDGLAKSSRNVYLSASERQIAPVLYSQIEACVNELVGGGSVSAALSKSRTALEQSGFQTEYFDLIDIDRFRSASKISDRSAVIVAARLGATRLIDNALLFPTRALL
jgi:pantoate--beta-alanine ligase